MVVEHPQVVAEDRPRRLSRKQAYVALANKLLRTLWALAVTGAPYQSAIVRGEVRPVRIAAWVSPPRVDRVGGQAQERIGNNPRLIRGDPAVRVELARGLRGRTRISSYVEPDGAVEPTDSSRIVRAAGEG